MSVTKLQTNIGYYFKDAALLTLALTHRSMRKDHNERLEFLGDAILSYIIAEALYARYPDLQEGELSRLRADLVKGETLATLARGFGVGKALQLGAGELKSGGQDRESILADATEALIAAIYLDSDMQTVRDCVLTWYGDGCFAQLTTGDFQKDPKSQLQEWLQARQYPLPDYVVNVTGKQHAQTFHVTCHVNGLVHEATGTGTSRRKAEQMAAEAYLKILGVL